MSGPIRVVQVVNSLAAAGAERMTVDIARSLPRDEFEVHVVVVRDGLLRPVLEASEIPVDVVGGEFDLRAPLVISRIAKRLRTIRPDIVHTHMIGSDIVGGLAAHLSGVPVIVSTQHDTYHRAYPYSLFRRYSARWLDAVVAVSPSVVDYCVSDRHVAPEIVRIIENAVDVDRFSSAIRAKRDPVAFGAIGTLIPVKAHSVLLEAFAQVRERVPGARLLIAGEGPESGRLLGRAAELGLSGAFKLRGRVANIAAFLAEVDVLVHPSLQEGLPLAVLEGMAAAKPVVASDLPAIRYALADGAAGELVPPGDAGALAAAMIRVATDDARAGALAAAGLARARERYSLERLAREHGELYRSLLEVKAQTA